MALINSVKNFFKANTWSGAAWLFTLCGGFVLVVVIYFGTHIGFPTIGNEFISLDKTQLKMIKKFLDSNQDTGTFKIDSIHTVRTELIMLYLKDEYSNKLEGEPKTKLATLLNKLSNDDVYDYLSDKKLLIKSPFWLTGGYVYVEALFWSLMGVLASLIFYVSIANAKLLKMAGDDDAGNFDPSEIPAQVAKLFYAPACTIVIILGYHYVSTDNTNMVDIGVNKGLIIFSFIAGFYSGRLMKFLDRLKELILPFGTTDTTKPNDSKTNDSELKTDATVQLKLSEAMSKSAEAADIIKAGFSDAKVTMTPDDGGDAISLLYKGTAEAPSDMFIAKQIMPGKYTIVVEFIFKKEDNTIINMTGSQDVEVTDSSKAFIIQLDKKEPAIGL